MEGGSVALGPEVGALPGLLGCQREAPSWRWSPANGKVSRILKGSMFDQGPFLADLMVFVEGSGHSPSYTLCFLVGQSWPQDQLWIKGLVRLKVVPTQLRALLDTALLGDASLLESTVDLHVSSSHPLSLPSTSTRSTSRTWWRSEFLSHWGGLSPHSSLYRSLAPHLDQ